MSIAQLYKFPKWLSNANRVISHPINSQAIEFMLSLIESVSRSLQRLSFRAIMKQTSRSKIYNSFARLPVPRCYCFHADHTNGSLRLPWFCLCTARNPRASQINNEIGKSWYLFFLATTISNNTAIPSFKAHETYLTTSIRRHETRKPSFKMSETWSQSLIKFSLEDPHTATKDITKFVRNLVCHTRLVRVAW